MKKTKTTTKQKILLISFSLILILLIIEFGFAKFVLLSVQNPNSFDLIFKTKQSNDVYKILALGESTTAGSLNSWPTQLEKTLNNKNLSIEFIVYNEGIGSVSTAYIVGMVHKNIEKYNPDMVITMMGVNDGLYNVIYKENFKISNFVQDLNTYKIFKSILNYLKKNLFQSSNSHHITTKEIELKLNKAILDNPNNSGAYVHLGFLNRDQGNIIKAQYLFLKALQINNSSAGAYHGLGWIYQKQGKNIDAENMYKKSIGFNSNDYNTFYLLGTLYVEQNKTEEAKQMLRKALKLNPNDVQTELLLIQLNNNQDVERDFRENLDIYVESDHNKSPESITKLHYQKLYGILKREKIKYAAMQYPTLELKPIRQFFSEEDQKKIIFISNKDNFKKALENEDYQYLFIDKFGLNQDTNSIFHGNFGHTTIQGSKLIAENVANIILEELNFTSS